MVKVMDHGHGTMERIVIIKFFFFFFIQRIKRFLILVITFDLRIRMINIIEYIHSFFMYIFNN